MPSCKKLNNTVQMSLPIYFDLSFFFPGSGIQAIDLLPDNWLLHFLPVSEKLIYFKRDTLFPMNYQLNEYNSTVLFTRFAFQFCLFLLETLHWISCAWIRPEERDMQINKCQMLTDRQWIFRYKHVKKIASDTSCISNI